MGVPHTHTQIYIYTHIPTGAYAYPKAWKVQKDWMHKASDRRKVDSTPGLRHQ